MRILSQNGMSDFPYDEVGLSIGYKGDESEFYIFCHHKLQDNGVRIATYSTAEKAQKAMEMLRNAYAGLPIIMRNVDITDDVAEMLKKWKKQGIVYQTADNEPTKIECVNNGYFRFPADDEIEV